MLTVYVDFKSAAAYLAIRPIKSLIERYSIACEWRPFLTRERDIPSEGIDIDVAESHARVRQATTRAAHQKYARIQGLPLLFADEPSGCELALGVLNQIQGDRLPFIDAAFSAYWQEQKDLNDAHVVEEVLKISGIDYSLDISTSASSLEGARQNAESIGIVEAPAFIIAQQLFIGREHLPWIEEIIQEESGAKRR